MADYQDRMAGLTERARLAHSARDAERIAQAMGHACPRCSDPMRCRLVRNAAGQASGFPADFVDVVFDTVGLVHGGTLNDVAQDLAKELNG